MSDNMLNGKIPRLPPSLIEVVNELTSEIYSQVDHAALAMTRPSGALAEILLRLSQEIIAASANAAHEASFDAEDQARCDRSKHEDDK